MDEDMMEMNEARPLAMAYVKWKTFKDVYAPELALSRGTVFPELDMPWIGEEAIPRG